MSQGDDSFHSLWPTTFLRRVLPGHNEANRHLVDLIDTQSLEQTPSTQQFTTDYLAQDFFALEDPAAEWLRSCVNKTVVDYLTHEKIKYDMDWSLQAWANINRKGDYHNLHNHPHSYLSGTYYVAVPSQSLPPQHRSDLNPAAISFFDPRPQANMNAIAGDGQVDPEYRVEPQAGMILLWPSFLHHFIHPNFSVEPRISISFNVLLKWNEAFVPKQS